MLSTSSNRFRISRIWFATRVVSDIAIALSLLWELSRLKSPFKTTQK
jgi:hypothetical protein